MADENQNQAPPEAAPEAAPEVTAAPVDAPADAPAAQEPPADAAGSRLDKLEAVLSARLGIDVRNFVHADWAEARKQQLEEAAAKAADLLREAIVSEEPLTVEQRLERIEGALRAATPLGHTV